MSFKGRKMVDEGKHTGKQKKPNKTQKNAVSIDFSINGCPLWLYKSFTSDISRYNDCYWVKLMDITRKAEMYDYMVRSNELIIYPEDEPLLKEDDKDRYGVQTIGGFQEYVPKVQERIKKDKELDKGENKNDK